MKRYCYSLGLLTFVALTFSVEIRAQISADEAAIRGNIKQLETGWNTKSGAVFAKPFAEDADCVVINGMYIKSRSVIEKAHQEIFDTILTKENSGWTVAAFQNTAVTR